MKRSKRTPRKQIKAGVEPSAVAQSTGAKQKSQRVAARPKNSSQTTVNIGTRSGISTDLEPTGSIRVYPNYPRTDAGNAELFARGFANKLRFDHRRGRWLVWRGHWWAQDENELVLQAAKRIARYRLHVLNYEIPLPSLTEQRQIVARVEELAAKIGEARGLRKQADEEAEALVQAALYRMANIETDGKAG